MVNTAKKSHNKKYPWQQPIKVCFFLLALVVSACLIINMPSSQKNKWTYDETTKSMQLLDADKKSPSKTDINPPKLQQDKPPKASEEVSNTHKIIKKIKSFTRLFGLVAIAAFLAGLMEARSWHIFFASFLRRITMAARLPQVVGISMPVALYSNASANAILVSSHSQGEISNSVLITGGMANSYLAHFSHSIRVLYPVVAIIGLPGLLYFFVQLFGGFLVIVIAFSINRYRLRFVSVDKWQGEAFTDKKQVLNWQSSIKLGVVRACSLLFRMTYITIPLMLAMEWLIKSGAFNFWEQYIPAEVAKYFPAESVSIIIAQIGGLVQSAGVSANLYAEGLVHNSQILLAMLVASAIGNPIRTLRRNLPTALGIFSPRAACTIVFTMQVARFLITVIGSILVITWMNLFLFQSA